MAAEVLIEKLIEEIRNLRSDFSCLSESLVSSARQRTSEAAERTSRALKETWSEAKDAAAGVADRIEDQPLTAAAVAFGIGMLLGMLLTTGRRR